MRSMLRLTAALALLAGGCAKDEDGDGFKANEDCDDLDAAAYPTADEVCDGIDNNCDGVVDEDTATDAPTWYADADADGYGDPGAAVNACEQPSGYVATDDDCDDSEPLAWTGAEEVCDGADNDCDGQTDPATSVDATTWYLDSDSDGDGDAAFSEVACDQPAGYVATDTDCDDDDNSTYPGAPEVCTDGYDNQCEEDNAWDCDDSDCTGDAACVPTLDGISPVSAAFGTSVEVTLTGSGFDWLTAGTTSVTFGSVGACTGVSVVSDTTVTCDAPAASADAVVDVTLSNSNGSDTLTAAFTYQNVIYAADGKASVAGNLYAVDPSDGSYTTVGALETADGTGYGFTGIAFSPDGVLYGVTSVSYSDTPRLCTIDTATAEVTVVATIARDDGDREYGIPDITFVGSLLGGWTESGDDPILIDTTTGVTTVLGPGTSSYGSGLASDGTDVYFISGPTLYSIDPSTAVVTATGSSASLTNSVVNAMTFHGGTLYGVDARFGSTSAAALITIDPTTGATTTIGDLPTGIDAIASPTP